MNQFRDSASGPTRRGCPRRVIACDRAFVSGSARVRRIDPNGTITSVDTFCRERTRRLRACQLALALQQSYRHRLGRLMGEVTHHLPLDGRV